MPANGQAFFIGEAGLLDVHVHVTNGADDSQGFVLRPAGIGVSDEAVKKIDAEVRKEVDEATEKCKAAPMPTDEILFTDVYADGGWAWRN